MMSDLEEGEYRFHLRQLAVLASTKRDLEQLKGRGAHAEVWANVAATCADALDELGRLAEADLRSS
jgi:hypothetical protein